LKTVASPLLLARECQAPFGVEVESRYTPKPLFAGGTDPRKHLTLQLEVSADVSSALAAGRSSARGELRHGRVVASITERDGCYTFKARIWVEGPRPATFRVGEGQLHKAAWLALSCELLMHGCFRAVGVQMALRPAYV
jgi:hypothetical protein